MTLLMRAPLACLLLPLGLLSGGCELMIAGPREQVSDQWAKTYEVTPAAMLQIDNTNGGITVRPHAGSSIQVTAHRTVRAVSQQAARELLERLTLEETATPDLVRLVTPRNQGLSMGQQIEVRYDVLVPATLALTLTTVNGQVDVEGVTGTVALETVNGGINARQVTALHKAETVNGSVKLALGSLPARGAKIETVNGGVSVALPGSQGVELSVRTVNGGIDVEGFASVSNAERKRRHYEGRLNGGGPTLRVETVNGGVSISGQAKATAPATAGGAR
jgi:hypothetical protein